MRIAVVGSGVGGLVSAHLLAPAHDVVVLEADARIGGHVHTRRVERASGAWDVDTGFIVYNERGYPLFSRLLAKLGVATRPTEMSFSVRSEVEGWEYNSATLAGAFGDWRNLVRPRHWRMLADIPRFYRGCRELVGGGDDRTTLGGYLRARGYSRAFVEDHLVPMGAAIWSSDLDGLERMPARFFAEFFRQHGLLDLADRPQWRTIVGGSARWIEALVRPFRDRIRTSCAVRRIERRPDGVDMWSDRAGKETFDHVILACHADRALALLADPTLEEAEVLGALRTRANDTVLHADSSLLPRRRAHRAAWNYHLLASPPPRPTVTYWMNRLQGIDCAEDLCVTLNRTEDVDPARVIERIEYRHPVYDSAALAAQRRRAALSRGRTHHAGACWGYGFHEDGVASAYAACEPFGVRP